ncbi:MAG: lysylphosphatidylglycerol synthase transmembrane domain-containing protein, partial [Myxococcota bacterium]|nr:lysylphosphatidylglycerol synthase transmembrane domain-containing protein [Myxococcota bacterium]
SGSRFVLQLLLSLIIGGGLCFLAFQGFDWETLSSHANQLSWRGVGLYFAIFAGAHLLRVLRWGLFVRVLSGASWRPIIRIGGIGYMAITLLPFRLGELVRPWLLARDQLLNASSALATVVVERIIDGLLFVGLFFICLSTLPSSDAPAVQAVKLGAYGAGFVFSALTLILGALAWRREATLHLLRRLGEPISPGLTARVLTLLEAFIDGLRVLPNLRTLLFFFTLTVIYWCLQGWGMAVAAEACGVTGLGLKGAFTLLSILVVGIMIPAGPGFTGSFELALVGGFALLSHPAEGAIPLYIIVLHGVQVSVQSLAGLLSLTLPRESEASYGVHEK